MTWHSKAEAQLSRKYGSGAWEWMPHWGKIRNRLSQRNYERYNRRMLVGSAVVPALVVSAATAIISALLIS